MTKYRQAPLIELIAELRWSVPNSLSLTPGFQPPPGLIPGNMPFFGLDQGRLDQFVALFSEQCFKRGIQSVERLIPPGFPIGFGQVSTRLKKSPASPELYQVGPGVFTANAIPPYDSWSAFCPFLESGIEILLESRIEGERDQPFTGVSLQYVDSFGPRLTGGMPAAKFVRDVLGFGIDAPPSIQALVAKDEYVNSTLQMNAILDNGLSLNISLGEGVANNVPGIIMHTTVVASKPVEPSARALLSVLNNAQDAQHAIFQGIAESIKHLMEPY
jgi:uncharacterized protein (TIGR04255 family)